MVSKRVSSSPMSKTRNKSVLVLLGSSLEREKRKRERTTLFLRWLFHGVSLGYRFHRVFRVSKYFKKKNSRELSLSLSSAKKNTLLLCTKSVPPSAFIVVLFVRFKKSLCLFEEEEEEEVLSLSSRRTEDRERESFCLLLGLGLLFFFFERENFQKSLSLFQRDFIRGERRRRRRPNDDDANDAKNNDFE